MKRLLLAAAFCLAATTAGVAADLPARAYTKAPVAYTPVDQWSGFYIGAMGGYGWQANSSGLGNSFSDIKGGFGGGTIGYNWMIAPNWLFGLEAEGAGADIKQTLGAIAALAPATSSTAKTEAFGSVGGRLGYVVGPVLIYGKAGFAFASDKASATVPGLGTQSNTQTQTGYTAGGGLEYMFAPSWSVKGEYLFAHYDSKNFTLFGGTAPSGDLELHTVKLGVNYHFNWGGPVVAKY